MPMLAVAATAALLVGAWQLDGGRAGQAYAQPAPVVAASSAAAAPEPAQAPAPAVAAEPIVVTAPAVAAEPTPEPAQALAVESALATPPAPPAPPAAAAPSPTIQITVASKESEPDAVDAQAVARAVAGLEHSMRLGDLEAGQRQLDDLAALLPARSLTLLRMHAWFAHQSGSAVEAITLYREITQRVPADRNSAINLAVLEAEQGDVAGASQRLQALRSSSGESAELAAAMAMVGAKPR